MNLLKERETEKAQEIKTIPEQKALAINLNI